MSNNSHAIYLSYMVNTHCFNQPSPQNRTIQNVKEFVRIRFFKDQKLYITIEKHMTNIQGDIKW